MQLWKKLKNKPFCNNVHFFLIAILLLLISFKYPIFYIVLMLFLLYSYKRLKLLYPILIIIIIFLFRILIDKMISINDNEVYEIQIIEVDDNTYDAYINMCKVRVSAYNHSYKPGDVISGKIDILEIEEKSYNSDFDYKEYLNSLGIKYNIKVINPVHIKNVPTLGIIKYNLMKYYEENLSTEAFQYVSAMVLAENDLDKDLKDGYSVLGISHILAISGLHIMILFKIISLICFKFLKIYRSTIPLLFLTIYVIIIGCQASCLRALLFLVLGEINKKGNVQYTRLDILSIACLIMLIICPYQIYNSGFILSYLVSFILIFINDFIKTKYKLISEYLSFYIIYFITFPIVINITNYISILALLLSPILSIAVTYVLLPLSYLSAIFPFMNFIFKYPFIFINKFIIGLYENSIGINIMSFNVFTISIYYILFIMLLIMLAKRKNIIKYFAIFILYIFVLINIRVANPLTKVTFINVGQGDSAIVELANDNGIMVIDAFNSFDYLKSIGIRKIDYLVLTHSDNDHIKDANDIIGYFDVEKIICPLYDDGFNDYEAIRVTNKNSFMLDNIRVDVLGPINEYEDKNSNSVVLKFDINGYSFLFTGDMTAQEEEDLIIKYDTLLKSDILKVGHHGSDSSSSEEFIRRVNPIYSIVSVGKNNNYGLPNSSVINRLEKHSTVYKTCDTGNITFSFYKNKMWIDTYR